MFKTVIAANAHASNIIAQNNNDAFATAINDYASTILANCYSNAYKILFMEYIAKRQKAQNKRIKRLARIQSVTL